MIGQTDLKRLLAYSSVEHMGLLVLGLGLGGVGPYGTVLHLVNNGLTKGVMFLAVGNVVLVTGSRLGRPARGILRRLPVTGVLLLLGLFAVTGSPPFGLFLSEFTILNAAIAQGHPVDRPGRRGPARRHLRRHGLGDSGGGLSARRARRLRPRRESLLLVGGPVVLLGAVLVLGLYVPPPLQPSARRGRPGPGGAGAMTTFDGLGLRNRRAIPLRRACPRSRSPGSGTTVLQAVRDGWRLVALFGSPEAGGQTRLIAVLGPG